MFLFSFVLPNIGIVPRVSKVIQNPSWSEPWGAPIPKVWFWHICSCWQYKVMMRLGKLPFQLIQLVMVVVGGCPHKSCPSYLCNLPSYISKYPPTQVLTPIFGNNKCVFNWQNPSQTSNNMSVILHKNFLTLWNFRFFVEVYNLKISFTFFRYSDFTHPNICDV